VIQFWRSALPTITFVQRPVSLESADTFWIRNGWKPLWNKSAVQLCGVVCALSRVEYVSSCGERRRPTVLLVSESVQLLRSRSYLAARHVPRCQQLLELVPLFGGLRLELTSAAHITTSGNYLHSYPRVWAPKGTSGTAMRLEIFCRCFSVSSLC
jgi:hypothetical protein